MYADSLIKYHYYIENMPTHEIPEIDLQKVNRILLLTQNSKALRGKSSADTSVLLNEINFDFAKTMNNIIFDKHLYSSTSQLITGNLTLPPRPKKKPAPYYGMISIPEHDYPLSYHRFCANTLLSRGEVNFALQDIRKEMIDVQDRDLYNPNIAKTMKVDDFKQIQLSSIGQTSYYLRETWINKLKDTI